MATLQTMRQAADFGSDAELPEIIPNPEKVKATAAVIRSSWSPRTRIHRAKLARSMLVGRFFAALLGPLELAVVPVAPSAVAKPKRRI